ncbi:hypothetical protein ACWG5P_23100 [Streptomyces prasinus]
MPPTPSTDSRSLQPPQSSVPRPAGGRTILELWVPAGELDEFNAHIVGGIHLVHTFAASPRGT